MPIAHHRQRSLHSNSRVQKRALKKSRTSPQTPNETAANLRVDEVEARNPSPVVPYYQVTATPSTTVTTVTTPLALNQIVTTPVAVVDKEDDDSDDDDDEKDDKDDKDDDDDDDEPATNVVTTTVSLSSKHCPRD
jgi:hypothetical protein